MELTKNLPINSSMIRNIDFWMEVKEVKISRQASIPHRVCFHLDSNLIQQITQIKNNHQQLSLSPKMLTDLRYYALLNSPLEQLGLVSEPGITDKGYYSNSLLIFNTDYLDANNERSSTVLQSNIDLKGKISQHIHQDLWHNPQLLEKISEVHYWLILEILAQLPFKRKNSPSRFIFGCLLIIVSLLALIVNCFFSLNWLENIVIFSGLLIIFNIQFKKMMNKQIKTWIIHHIASSFLLKNIKVRLFSMHILAFII